MIAKEIEINGEKHKVELDPSEHGYVHQDRVNQLRDEFYQKGYSKRESEIAGLNDEMTALKDQLESTKKRGGSKDAEVLELKNELASLTKRIMDKEKEAREATITGHIKSHAARLKMREGGVDTFSLYASHARTDMEDGSVKYKLPAGGIGEIEDYAKQWISSDTGKAFALSDQRGGSGTEPRANHDHTGKKFNTLQEKADFIKEHGEKAYFDLLWTTRTKKTG